ncbi:hypothetical protein XELAEV_18043912mg [Xenopus laevis]|uniref:Uncharacterized protein n=1 Tax=Xenopus laevis TaxID=8355 RepID=A0A974H387_XENLA|nr:hypothetical protein XELAEV_18043912mg [Xenopus laevis]
MIKCACSLAYIEMVVEQVKDHHKNVINISNESTISILLWRTLRNIVSARRLMGVEYICQCKGGWDIDRNTLGLLKKAEWVYESKAADLNGPVISI